MDKLLEGDHIRSHGQADADADAGGGCGHGQRQTHRGIGAERD